MAKKPKRDSDEPTPQEAEGLRQLLQMVLMMQNKMRTEAPDQYEKMMELSAQMQKRK